MTVSAEETNKNFNVAEMMQRYQSPEQKVLAALDAIVTTLKSIDSRLAPGHTDLMVSPEEIEAATSAPRAKNNRKGK